MGSFAWPTARGEPHAFSQRYGSACAVQFRDAMHAGDPLADALVAVTGNRGKRIRWQFAHGIRYGLASVHEPDDTIVELLRSAESAPLRADDTLITTGPRSWCDVPFRVHLLSLCAGALISVYASPSIASVLNATGRLNRSTEERLRTTAVWLSSTMQPGSLKVGQSGYVATLQLRLVHARARNAARRRGHDEQRFGQAINQLDLAATWLAFTLVRMRAEGALGYIQADSAVAENYRYWQQLAHLLGIDPGLVGGIQNHQQAEHLEQRIAATNCEPQANSVELTARTLKAVANALDRPATLSTQLPQRVLETLARRIHGDEQADALEIHHSPGVAMLMAPVAAITRAQRALRGDQTDRWNELTAGRYADALAAAIAEQATK